MATLDGSTPRTVAPRTATHRAQLHTGAGALPAFQPHQDGPGGRRAVRRFPSLPAIQGTGAAPGGPGRALSTIQAPGGALPRGAAAVPLLGGSMPRAAAPRMAAHRAQLHGGAAARSPITPTDSAAAQICVVSTRRTAQAGARLTPPPGAKKFEGQGRKTAWPLACEIFSPMGDPGGPGAPACVDGAAPSWAALGVVPDSGTGIGKQRRSRNLSAKKRVPLGHSLFQSALCSSRLYL